MIEEQNTPFERPSRTTASSSGVDTTLQTCCSPPGGAAKTVGRPPPVHTREAPKEVVKSNLPHHAAPTPMLMRMRPIPMGPLLFLLFCSLSHVLFRCPTPHRWINYDDSEVNPITQVEVFEDSPYLLFYSRE